jgi:hypothetical protein
MTEEDLVSVEAYLTKGRLARAGVVFGLALGLAAAGLAPSRAQECGAAACLKTELGADVASELAGGTATLEALAGGLTLSYAGANPIPARLIAARYDDGRLVRYGVSARVTLSADQPVAFPDAADVIRHAFVPATHRTVELGAVGGEAAQPIMLQSFVGNVPPTNLGGEPGKALLTPEEAAAYTGTVGLIVIEPDDPALRDGAAAASTGALVQLTLVKP